MFTGLIETTGKLISQVPWVIEVRGQFPQTKIGDSVAINGCCLTVTKMEFPQDRHLLHFDLSPETLQKTNLGHLKTEDEVNLEWALEVGQRLGGHWVTGHVDTTGTVLAFDHKGDFWNLKIQFSADYQNHFVRKGSVTVDGVSLTINHCERDFFEVMIIPHTLHKTTLKHYSVGQKVNLETDILGKYALRALENSPYENVQHS